MCYFFFKQKTAYEVRISDWIQTCALPISFGLTTLSQGRSRHPASTRAFGYIHLVHPFMIKARLPVRPADRRGGRFADGSQQYTTLVGMQVRQAGGGAESGGQPGPRSRPDQPFI